MYGYGKFKKIPEEAVEGVEVGSLEISLVELEVGVAVGSAVEEVVSSKVVSSTVVSSAVVELEKVEDEEGSVEEVVSSVVSSKVSSVVLSSSVVSSVVSVSITLRYCWKLSLPGIVML